MFARIAIPSGWNAGGSGIVAGYDGAAAATPPATVSMTMAVAVSVRIIVSIPLFTTFLVVTRAYERDNPPDSAAQMRVS